MSGEDLGPVAAERDAGKPHQKPNYPFNCWWVAGTAAEVTRTPLSRWLLGKRIMLFRTEQGAVSAIEDRCPHRWAPLSDGRLIGDEIECPYHGVRFNAGGACTHVPFQSQIPSALKVRTFPIYERGSFLWIWMGDPARADVAKLPEIPWFADPDPGIMQLRVYKQANCNYMAIHENLLDLSHIPYLHATAAGDAPGADDTARPNWDFAPEVRVADDTVGVIMKSPIGFGESARGGADAAKADAEASMITSTSVFMSPAYNRGDAIMPDPPAGSGAPKIWTHVMHCTTPISPTRTHWWWAVAQNFALGEKERMQKIGETVVMQDKTVLEAIQETTEQDTLAGLAPTQVLLSVDSAPMRARHMIGRILAAD